MHGLGAINDADSRLGIARNAERESGDDSKLIYDQETNARG